VPKKVEPAVKRTEQVLLRLTADELDWLESAAHLERITVNSYAYGLIRAHVDTLRHNPHVLADRANRRSYDSAVAEAHPLQQRRVDVGFADVETAEATTTNRTS
jgi:uncharacterized protein (DUF1778 family)